MKFDKLVLLSIILCTVVVVGELTTYGSNIYRYDANVDFGDESIDVSVTSSGSDTYSIILMDSGNYSPVAQLYIYYNERYDEFFEKAHAIVGLSDINMEYVIDQVIRSLKVRGFDEIFVLNDEELLGAMLDDAGDSASKGLLIMSYSLPESIYAGLENDILFQWLNDGGSLYWMSSPIGMFYHTDDDLILVEDAQERFFGKECVNLDDIDPALSVIEYNGLTEALYLKWNRVLYGLNIQDIEGAVAIGFIQDGYTSVSFVPFGKGMVCVIGGNYERHQCDDITQIISSGVSCYSKILEVVDGSVLRETVEITLKGPVDTEGVLTIYISIGGYYTVFGRAFSAK